MKATELRRKDILKLLSSSESPVAGSKLADILEVSRQVIVQDIAILKAENHDIVSTNKGYRILKKPQVERVIKVSHSDERIEEELNIIVDGGAWIKDVFISHRAYGIIRASLNIRSRRDTKKLLEDIKAGISKPLKRLTGDYHYHTICAEKEEILQEVIEELKKKNFLVEK